MIRLDFLMACLMLTSSAQAPSQTDWRGLTPLRSTILDVERTLGPPNQKRDNNLIIYYLYDVTVYFYLDGNPKCHQKLSFTSWNVTPDVVTGIDVFLKDPPLIEETGTDLTKLKKIQGDFDLVDRYIYLNDDASFGIEAGPRYITGYHYQPGIKQKELRCERSDRIDGTSH